MIPIRLQIEGFLSYRERVDLSFNDFDLACISGSNGAGKSSLLDAITWVLFGEARRKDDTIINHQSTGAEVILDFSYEDTVYRVQRSKKKNESTKLEFFIQGSNSIWKPLTEATMRATEERIRSTMRLDYETFINASFFLQGRADQFAQQRPGDRKRILSAILGLEAWEKYKDETAHRRRTEELELASVDGLLKEIDAELNEEAARRQNLATLEQKHKVNNELAETKKALLDQQRLLTDRINAEKRQVEKQAAEIRRLQTELDFKVENLRSRQEERIAYLLQIESEEQIKHDFAEWQKTRAELEVVEKIAANFRQFESKRQTPLLKIEAERASLETELNALKLLKNDSDSLKAKIPEINLALDEINRLIKADINQLEMRPVLEVDLRNLVAEKVRVKTENAALKMEMDDLKERIATLQVATGANCPTCEKPLNSAERHRLIDTLTTRGTEKGNTYRENQRIADHCDVASREKETQLQSLLRAEADLKLQQRLFDQKNDELHKAEETLQKWEQTSLPRMIDITTRLSKDDYAIEARQELARVDAELKQLGYDAIEHEKLRLQEQSGRSSQERVSQLDKAKAALVPLERELQDLENAIDQAEAHLKVVQQEYREADAKLAEITAGAPNLDAVEREYYTIQEQVNQLLTEVGYARNQVDVIAKQKVQKETRLEEKSFINHNIANLKILEKAFGKDGIPALLIEQSLPEIESHTNEILDRLSSGNMSVKFETQRDFRDKKREDRKETLDILIRDSAGEREYELFSGGEAFRINFAIRLALSRVLSNRAGARLQTLVIDEGFGSQDSDGRQRLIEAINLVQDDFAKILVITHLEELKDAFPARLDVVKTNTGSHVNVVVG
jgi:exonuclease SbcC